MTNAIVAEGMRAIRPGIVLLAHGTRETPLQQLPGEEYRMVYHDQRHRLHVLPKIIEQAEPWPEPIPGGDLDAF